MTAADAAPILPAHVVEDSQLAFERLDTHLKAAGKHPTRTTSGSLWVPHADGTSTHWNIRRSMTNNEVKRSQDPNASRTLNGFDECGRRIQPLAPSLWKRVRGLLGLIRR